MQNNRFIFLDGIRGIAAIFVLIRHTPAYWNISFFRSYLAVDLFFILSGFVIAYAYEKKLRQGAISVRQFFLIRLIRLYPIFLLSLIICSALLSGKLIATTGISPEKFLEVSSVVILTSLFLPSILSGSSYLFPLNALYWSLFFELIANFIFACFRPKLTNGVVMATIIFSGAILIAITRNSSEGIDFGFYWDAKSILAGFARSIFGIFFGLFLYRQHTTLAKHFCKHFNVLPWLAIVIVVFALASPSIGQYNSIVDMLIIAVVFPVCVLLASLGEHSKTENLLGILGSASYPIYVLHIPANQIVSHLSRGAEAPYAPFSGVLFVTLLVALSVWLEKRYDIPVRKYLSSHALKIRR
jgi:peptidoglycan/LPS O-acetylase OafA/YrhL